MNTNQLTEEIEYISHRSSLEICPLAESCFGARNNNQFCHLCRTNYLACESFRTNTPIPQFCAEEF
jgi:hypothetical protein